jgi:hypothetical protein
MSEGSTDGDGARTLQSANAIDPRQMSMIYCRYDGSMNDDLAFRLGIACGVASVALVVALAIIGF